MSSETTREPTPLTAREIHRIICGELRDSGDLPSIVVGSVLGNPVTFDGRFSLEDLRDLCEKALLLEELERVLPVELTDVAKRLRAKRLER